MNIKRPIPYSIAALAILATIGPPPPPAYGQTVTTPPRSITSQQETPGVDSTFQGNVQPNTVPSTITLSIPSAPAPAPAPPPAPPPQTCFPGSTNTTVTRTITPTVTQTAACPAGYLTTAYASTFTQSATQTDNQSATQTTTTTCPSGIYGSPSTSSTTGAWTTTSSSTGAWSPTPASACPVKTAYQLAINGGSYTVQSYRSGAGSTWTTRAALSVGINPNGTYQVICTIIGSGASSPCMGGVTVASGTWLPVGRSASDFTIAITLTPSRASVDGPVPCGRSVPACSGSDGDSYAGSGPYTSTANDPNNVGAVTSITTNGATGAGVVAEAGGHDFMRSDPAGSMIGGFVDATVSVAISDRLTNQKATTTFTFTVAAQ